MNPQSVDVATIKIRDLTGKEFYLLLEAYVALILVDTPYCTLAYTLTRSSWAILVFFNIIF